jgi:hypothetical protein
MEERKRHSPNQKSQDDMPQHMERSFRTVYIPKKLAGTRDGERRKPPRQVEEDDDDDDDDEAGEAAAASAGQEPQAMVRIKLPHAITSAVQTSFQDFFSTLGLCYQSLQKISTTKGIWQGRERERERIAATTKCAVCALSCVGSVVSEGGSEWMERASERASEQGAWGCAVDRAWRNQMQPRVAFQCKDQWEVGELRQDNLLQASPPPPPTPSFFPFSFFFCFCLGGFSWVFFFGSRGRMGFYVLIWKFLRFFPKFFAKLVEFILEKHIYIPMFWKKPTILFFFSKNKYINLKLSFSLFFGGIFMSLVGGKMDWDFFLFFIFYFFLNLVGERGRKRDIFQLLFVMFLQYE